MCVSRTFETFLIIFTAVCVFIYLDVTFCFVSFLLLSLSLTEADGCQCHLLLFCCILLWKSGEKAAGMKWNDLGLVRSFVHSFIHSLTNVSSLLSLCSAFLFTLRSLSIKIHYLRSTFVYDQIASCASNSLSRS